MDISMQEVLLAVAALTAVAGHYYVSIYPGSLLGFAITPSEWNKIVRGAFGPGDIGNSRELISAAKRSAISQLVLIAIAAIGAINSANNSNDLDFRSKAVAAIVGAIAGVLLGYFLVTRTK